ncbi:MAG: tyrosine-type recombinase/integrase [Chloroflexota bacterium]
MTRDVLALASNALERQVIAMWLGAGYVPSTVERRIRDKWRIYRRLGRNERDSRIARKLTCESVSRIAQDEARRRPGNRKLNARVMRASLRAWADALRALGKPVTAWISQASRGLIDEYWSHTRRIRDLAEKTFKEHRLYVTWFLEDLKKRKIGLHAIALTDVDHFVSTLTTQRKLALTSAANACICVRHFLRFLYRTRRIGTDLAPAVIGPTLRQMVKRPPERVSWAALKRVLGAVDRTRPLGKRDFAIFVTAASYGWGAADVLSLRLDDIDWYRNTLSIVRPKTGVRIEVPLLPQVAHALATYVQTARPPNTGKREVFLRHYAPWAKVPTTTSIESNLQRYAEKAGIPFPPRYRMKVFRCAHIAEQLNRGVPPKVVVDVVGHSDTRSISRYAGIDIEQLRRCALPVPK